MDMNSDDDIIQKDIRKPDLQKTLDEFLKKGYDVKQITSLRKRRRQEFYRVIFEKVKATTYDDGWCDGVVKYLWISQIR